MRSFFEEQFKDLDVVETNQTVLVNSFEELEPEAFRAFENLNMISIGPLIPSDFLDKKLDPTEDNKFGGQIHIFQPSD
ncbi:putative anthocyanidin 3-O-glucoside 5-O-glucosyltransferase [Medicago truncatula]|uniref:Putative anthocyanidin 3-O-glucoside 5-O-glucosyltransferase n=2 Tax=Medicago truncatula TaxID=3880 RepID=A0A396GSP7_MEDTR|nr:putative anthocyanidin 3-O-glucoside 5-O-glucosyltransferase [Medicago truncatula]